eukprot:2494988-Prymnesium_polylepis.1
MDQFGCVHGLRVQRVLRVRAAKLPSANGHASAAALAAVLEAAGASARVGRADDDRPRLFSRQNVDEMRDDQRNGGGGERVGTGDVAGDSEADGEGGGSLLDNAGAAFGLGVQVHEFTLSDGTRCRSLGHSGL